MKNNKLIKEISTMALIKEIGETEHTKIKFLEFGLELIEKISRGDFDEE